MSDVNWRLLIRRRDHTFAAPVPEMTAKYGVPNACTTCHEDRTPEWAAAAMDAWYGDGDRRRRAMRVADAFYLAGAKDTASLPALASLAVDRTHGMLVRASAAEFIGQVFGAAAGRAQQGARTGPSQTSLHGAAPPAAPASTADAAIAPDLARRLVNSLIGAANDPEPTVRAVAVRSLGIIGDRHAVVPLVARLRDDVRTVRTAAAEALMWIGVTSLPPPAGDVLARAQDELAASLTTFQDVVASHATRGLLESERGRQDEAARALDTALELDPQHVRARVFRGMVAARSGQLREAIRHWETAKKIDPAYPNLDRLIAEAQRQSGQPR
jgi:HEAT repeat protein